MGCPSVQRRTSCVLPVNKTAGIVPRASYYYAATHVGQALE